MVFILSQSFFFVCFSNDAPKILTQSKIFFVLFLVFGFIFLAHRNGINNAARNVLQIVRFGRCTNRFGWNGFEWYRQIHIAIVGKSGVQKTHGWCVTWFSTFGLLLRIINSFRMSFCVWEREREHAWDAKMLKNDDKKEWNRDERIIWIEMRQTDKKNSNSANKHKHWE